MLDVMLLILYAHVVKHLRRTVDNLRQVVANNRSLKLYRI